jgi:transcriptional regulator with XRE-family HTH domain
MRQLRELDPGSSPLAYYGSELRRLRVRANLTQRQLGLAVHITDSMIAHIEAARRPPSREFNMAADMALEAEGALLRLWPLVSRSGLPQWFRHYAELEANAIRIYTYQSQLVHGLLQTADYARAVLRTAGEEHLDERVASRLERQLILDREKPPHVWAVLDEAVLHRPIGGKEVMRRQLAHLLSITRRPRVNLQILPFSVGTHAGLRGSFTVLRFGETADVAYSEGYNSGITTIDPEEVAARSLHYDLIHAAAPAVEESAELIARVMEERYGDKP